MKEKICYLVGAGESGPLPALGDGDLLIAVDGGLLTCLREGRAPSLLVGDLDSLAVPPPADIPLVRFPVRKDETDTYLAYLEGVKRGYTRFEIYGGLGGRADHTVANMQLLYRIASEGRIAALVGEGVRMVAFSDGAQMLVTVPGSRSACLLSRPYARGSRSRAPRIRLRREAFKTIFLSASPTPLSARA